jgi:hypothetical protein
LDLWSLFCFNITKLALPPGIKRYEGIFIIISENEYFINMRKLFLIVFFLYLGIGQGNTQVFQKSGLKNADRGLFHKSSLRKKEAKVKEPRSVIRAKKKQEAKDRKTDRETKKYIKWSRKRAIDIQTPEVQDRMKQDRKDIESRNREKRKMVKEDSKKAGRKYK